MGIKMGNNQKSTSKRWGIKKWSLPLVVAIVGVVGSIIIGNKQVESAEKIAESDQQIKMWELIVSKQLMDTRYDQDVWTDDP